MSGSDSFVTYSTNQVSFQTNAARTGGRILTPSAVGAGIHSARIQTVPRRPRGKAARRRITALVHDSKLTVNDPNPEASHRPILYDSGRPSSVIWFRTLHATTDSATRPPRDRARSRSPRIDVYRKNAFSTRAWSG